MKKELIIAISVGSIIGLSIAGLLWLRKSNAQPVETAEIVTADVPDVAIEQLVWTDPAGFTFQYPAGIEIDKHDEDTENYAHLELTHPEHQGNILVWASDTNSKDAAAWMKTQNELKALSSLDTQLGELSAKKVLVPSVPTKVITATVTDSIVFWIEGTFDDKVYWESVYESIIDSFVFVDDQANAQGDASLEDTSFEEVVDEEEVIE